MKFNLVECTFFVLLSNQDPLYYMSHINDLRQCVQKDQTIVIKINQIGNSQAQLNKAKFSQWEKELNKGDL